MRMGWLPFGSFIASVSLGAAAWFNPAAAGLGFDILGALLLLFGPMKSAAALERYWAKATDEGPHHLAQRKKLPYHQRFPLWVAGLLGSKDIMVMNQESHEESLTGNFWAAVFLVLGFALQLIGTLKAETSSTQVNTAGGFLLPPFPEMSDEVTAALVGAVVGVVVSFSLPFFTEWWKGRARRLAHWAALGAEIDYCRDRAEIYLRENVASPLYRLPTVAYAHSLPALLEAAALLEETDTRDLLSFFSEVETFNRGLDQVDRARLITDPAEQERSIQAEYKRNKIKAEDLVGKYYAAAKAIVMKYRRPKRSSDKC
jgi:hypothetical protein